MSLEPPSPSLTWDLSKIPSQRKNDGFVCCLPADTEREAGEMLRIQISPVLNSLQAPHKTLQIMLLTSKKKSQKFTLISVSCYN